MKYSANDLLEFKNFGQKSADEVCESLKRDLTWILENKQQAFLKRLLKDKINLVKYSAKTDL